MLFSKFQGLYLLVVNFLKEGDIFLRTLRRCKHMTSKGVV